MTDAPKTTATDEASEASRRDRARDLAELGDYVRLLADRMGLKDWTFAVEDGPKRGNAPDEKLLGWIYPRDKNATFAPRGEFFALVPESRRLCVAEWLVRCHVESADYFLMNHLDDGDFFAYADRLQPGLDAIAAAWAPCLPLPLVGLMRRADEVARP